MVSIIVGEYVPCRKSFAKIQTASNNLLQYHPEPSYTPFYEAYSYPLWQKRIISAGLSFIPTQDEIWFNFEHFFSPRRRVYLYSKIIFSTY